MMFFERIPEGTRKWRGPIRIAAIITAPKLSLATEYPLTNGQRLLAINVLDPRSIDINTEMGILVHSPELAAYFVSEIDKGGLEHVYQLKLVRSPAESQGEFTTYTWNIEWLERLDGETVRHTSEPDVGAPESIKLFFSGLAPESLI